MNLVSKSTNFCRNSLNLLIGMFIFVSACAFDKSEVDKEMDKRNADEKSRRQSEYSSVTGTYEGKLFRINNQESPIRIILTTAPTGTDHFPEMYARVQTSDNIQTYDVSLKGEYSAITGKLNLKKISEVPPEGGANAIIAGSLIAMDGAVVADHILGSLLLNIGGSLGNFDVIKISDETKVPGEGEDNPTDDEYFKKARKALEEIEGTYRGKLIPASNEGMPYNIVVNLYLPFPTKLLMEGTFAFDQNDTVLIKLAVTNKPPILEMSGTTNINGRQISIVMSGSPNILRNKNGTVRSVNIKGSNAIYDGRKFRFVLDKN